MDSKPMGLITLGRRIIEVEGEMYIVHQIRTLKKDLLRTILI